jgi:hypothetical protein
MTKKIGMALVGLIVAGVATAADFDGSKKLICAPVQVVDCVAGAECVKGIPDDFGAPAFMRVDVGGRKVSGPKTTSEILSVDRSTERQLLLTGREQGFGWTMAIDGESGAMVTTLTARSGAYTLFGNCTPL